MMCSAWLLVVGGQVQGSKLCVQEEGCCTTEVVQHPFFLPFSLPTFAVNGQTSLIFVRLCDLVNSIVLLIYPIHRLFSFSMYHLYLLLDQKSFLTLSIQTPLICVFFYSFFQNPCFTSTGLFISPSGISELDCAKPRQTQQKRSYQ